MLETLEVTKQIKIKTVEIIFLINTVNMKVFNIAPISGMGGLQKYNWKKGEETLTAAVG
jgi:hypothetical protein